MQQHVKKIMIAATYAAMSSCFVTFVFTSFKQFLQNIFMGLFLSVF